MKAINVMIIMIMNYDHNDDDDEDDEHYSKSLGGRPQGTWMGLLTASGSLARCR